MTTWKVFARMPTEFGGEDYAAECYRNGMIAIGWNEVGDLNRYSTFEQVKDALRRQFSRRIAGNERRAGAWAASLWAFKDSMRRGDRILCPDGMTGKVYVGTITSVKPFYDDAPIGGNCRFAHRRRVRWDARPGPDLGRLGGKQTVSRIDLPEPRLRRLLSPKAARRKRRSSMHVGGKPDPVWGREAELRAIEWLRSQGQSPVDVARLNRGWDIETDEGVYEVKGRRSKLSQVMLTQNEWRAARRHRQRYTLLVFTAANLEDLSRALPEKFPDPAHTCDWRPRHVYEYYLAGC